ncbi:MAG: 3-phosphoserine/phosphohydroxythreonine transaminase, partial [Anaerovoracaceae bacterium]
MEVAILNSKRAYNFSAGPSMLPLEVMEDAASELTNYQGCGESVMEMSHRSKAFEQILHDAEANLRTLLNIPENYKVMFLQGGGTLQFSMIPLNLMRNSRKADYIVTGSWAKKAAKEAEKFGDVKIVASSEADTFTYIPEVKKEDFRADADYVHITYNNTIYGTHFSQIPDTGDIPLVADMSSCILSEEIDVTKFGVIYAGAQKNIGPSGVTIVIMREDLIGFADEKCPVYLDYKIHADNDSMYNTPPCFGIYIAGEVFKLILKKGGIAPL